MNTNKNKRKGIFFWIGRILLGLLILFLGLILFGLIREQITRRNIAAEYPAPGEMVNINGHDIHLYCVGSGTPTVIFESDIDQLGILSWVPVQEEISKYTRTCSYDRAGIMWSEDGELPRDGETIADELSLLLETAGEEGPYVLVSHAFGSIYTRIFAGNNPEDVIGMVTIDSSHPDMLTRFAEMGIEKEIPDKNVRPIIWLLSHLGMPDRSSVPDYIDPIATAFTPKSSLAWFEETAEAPTSLTQASTYEDLGDIPLILLASAYTSADRPENEIYYNSSVELQSELLALSDDSEIRIFDDNPKAGHYMQLQTPELVIEAIQDVLEKCE